MGGGGGARADRVVCEKSSLPLPSLEVYCSNLFVLYGAGTSEQRAFGQRGFVPGIRAARRPVIRQHERNTPSNLLPLALIHPSSHILLDCGPVESKLLIFMSMITRLGLSVSPHSSS